MKSCHCQRQRRHREDDRRHQFGLRGRVARRHAWPIWIATSRSPTGTCSCKPQIFREEPINKLIPVVDPERCTHCGAVQPGLPLWRDCLRRAADVDLRGTLPLLRRLSCWPARKTRSAKSRNRSAVLRTGTSGAVQFVEGVLNVGEAMSPPAIRAVKNAAPDVELTILDCPPGTSCPVIESVRGCDLLLLVTEPTPFGLHDLKLAVEMARALELEVRRGGQPCRYGGPRGVGLLPTPADRHPGRDSR